MKNIGVIPAYQPRENLLNTVDDTLKLDFLFRLIIVDDGSGENFRHIFDSLAKRPKVIVLRHAINQGMGGAIKTAFNYILCNEQECNGAIAFDADGQHLPIDIKRVTEAADRNPGMLILGVRDFHNSAIKIPLRSKIGNRVTELLFTLFTGIKLTDTQTGLRYYPVKMMKKCLTITNNRYEFQLQALLICGTPTNIIQIPIETIYENNNECSHFNPIRDSLRIYKVLFGYPLLQLAGFFFTGLGSAVIDLSCFAILFKWILPDTRLPRLVTAVVGARIISSLVNYLMNRNLVFRPGSKKGPADLHSLFHYFLLCLFITGSSYYLVRFAIWTFPKIDVVILKACADALLFFVSFFTQKLFIFRKDNY